MSNIHIYKQLGDIMDKAIRECVEDFIVTIRDHESMYSTATGQAVITAITTILQGLIDNGGNKSICNTIYTSVNYGVYSEFEHLAMCLYPSWEHFSGNDEYPIPCPDDMVDIMENGCYNTKQYNAVLFYYWCDEYHNFWGGEAGELRKSLCQHILDAINTILEEDNNDE